MSEFNACETEQHVAAQVGHTLTQLSIKSNNTFDFKKMKREEKKQHDPTLFKAGLMGLTMQCEGI